MWMHSTAKKVEKCRAHFERNYGKRSALRVTEHDRIMCIVKDEESGDYAEYDISAWRIRKVRAEQKIKGRWRPLFSKSEMSK